MNFRSDPTSSFLAALTFSEAVTDPADYAKSQCGARAGVDPEDPRCAKITLSGTKPLVELYGGCMVVLKIS